MIKKTINGAELATKYVRPSSKVITLMVSQSMLQVQSPNLEGMDKGDIDPWGDWENE